MLGKGNHKAVAGAQTLIAANAQVIGDVHFTGGLHVQGRVRGNIIAGPEGGDLVIGEGGIIEGEIRAPHVAINGEVRGDVHSSDRLELAARAVVTGNVHYRLIEIVVGARVDGVLRHEPPAAPENPD
ncbi:MAG: bactofilin family protein [Pseudomonadota bacterium]